MSICRNFSHVSAFVAASLVALTRASQCERGAASEMCAATSLLQTKASQRLAAQAGTALQAQSMALHQRIQAFASKLEPGPTKEFLSALRLCAACKDYKRVGEANDGGYVMCADGLDNGLVGALSYGVNGFDGWGMEVASRYRIPVREYDCTNLNQPKVCAGCDVSFHAECVLHNGGDAEAEARALRGIGDARAADNEGQAKDTAKVTGASFKTLGQMLTEAGIANVTDRSLLLKMDVESAEWPVFAEEPVANMRKFREIVVEYHGIHDVKQHALYAKAVKNIQDAGFSVSHMHGNNYGGPMQSFGEYRIPDVIEVTYIQTPEKGCSTDIPYHLDLDMSNSADPNWAEMPDAVLPTSF